MDEAGDIAHALELVRRIEAEEDNARRAIRRAYQRLAMRAERRGDDGPFAFGRAGRKPWSDAEKVVYALMQVWLRHGHPEPSCTPTGPFIRWIVEHAPEAATPRSLQRVVARMKKHLAEAMDRLAAFGYPVPYPVLLSPGALDTKAAAAGREFWARRGEVPSIPYPMPLVGRVHRATGELAAWQAIPAMVDEMEAGDRPPARDATG